MKEKTVCFLLIWIPLLAVFWMMLTLATAPSLPAPVEDRQHVVVYEDGSGVQYAPGTDREIRTFPEDTFAWDCHTMGNGICGPGH